MITRLRAKMICIGNAACEHRRLYCLRIRTASVHLDLYRAIMFYHEPRIIREKISRVKYYPLFYSISVAVPRIGIYFRKKLHIIVFRRSGLRTVFVGGDGGNDLPSPGILFCLSSFILSEHIRVDRPPRLIIKKYLMRYSVV